MKLHYDAVNDVTWGILPSEELTPEQRERREYEVEQRRAYDRVFNVYTREELLIKAKGCRDVVSVDDFVEKFFEKIKPFEEK